MLIIIQRYIYIWCGVRNSTLIFSPNIYVKGIDIVSELKYVIHLRKFTLKEFNCQN